MSEELQVYNQSQAAILEKVLVQGDLSKLTPAERLQYYKKTCETLGLNPFTKPFDYIVLNGKLTLYARRDATEQLRKLNGISIKITSREQIGDLYIVQAQATDKDGRCDESIGAVSIAGLKGDALANAMMKAETKAKRRVTLSLSGLGWLDESEIETIPDAKLAKVNENTGEIEAEIISDNKSQRQQQRLTPDSDDTISKAQAKRMYALSNGDAELCKRIMQKYGYEKSEQVKKIDYNKICEEIEAEVAAE